MKKASLIKIITVTLAGSTLLTSPLQATTLFTTSSVNETNKNSRTNITAKLKAGYTPQKPWEDENLDSKDDFEKDITVNEEIEKSAIEIEDTSTSENNVTDTDDSLQEENLSLQTQYENRVLELVNIERKKNNLKPLAMDENVRAVARIKSTDMYQHQYFSHTSPTYGTPFQMLKSFNITYSVAAENIACGQKTPEEVVTGWMNSSEHRANILNTKYSKIGISLEENGYYWTQLFID